MMQLLQFWRSGTVLCCVILLLVYYDFEQKTCDFTPIHVHVTAVLAPLLTAALADQKTAAGYCACRL